jgi:flagellar biosynthesis/type III secretory pathway chaperone
MNEELVFELTRKELGLLRDLSRVLKEERDAIISFSLEGIIEESNRKEEILRKLEFLKNEKEKLLQKGDDDPAAMKDGQTWSALCKDMNHTIKDVRGGMEKNMKLLSFSMDHVKSSIENIVGLLNRSVYGKKRERISLLLARSV